MEWIAFCHEGQELGRISLDGMFPGELRATAELLAYEHGVPAEAITARVIREPRRKP